MRDCLINKKVRGPRYVSERDIEGLRGTSKEGGGLDCVGPEAHTNQPGMFPHIPYQRGKI